MLESQGWVFQQLPIVRIHFYCWTHYSHRCYTCEEITTKVEAFRSLLLRQNQPSAFPLLPFVYQTLLQPAQVRVFIRI